MVPWPPPLTSQQLGARAPSRRGQVLGGWAERMDGVCLGAVPLSVIGPCTICVRHTHARNGCSAQHVGFPAGSVLPTLRLGRPAVLVGRALPSAACGIPALCINDSAPHVHTCCTSSLKSMHAPYRASLD